MEHNTKNSIIFTNKMFLTDVLFHATIIGTKEQPPSFAASFADQRPAINLVGRFALTRSFLRVI
jgi:hypothetical protein